MTGFDPLLHGPRAERRLLLGSGIVAVALHSIAGLALPEARRELEIAPLTTLEVIDVMPSEPESEPEPEPEPEPERAPAAVSTLRAPESPAPSPARAAEVVTREVDPSAPIDFTEGVVIGSASTYAGGTTSSSGRSTRAVGSRGVASHGSAPSGSGAQGGAAVDRSRRPALLGGADWRCAFPSEADSEGIDGAVVTIRVSVDATARPRSVAVLSDPGHGFGAAARRCALSRRWLSALDRQGRPASASVTVNVRFSR